MKYKIGNIVTLDNGITIYITETDDMNKKYKGFDVENDNPNQIIVFKESQVIIKI